MLRLRTSYQVWLLATLLVSYVYFYQAGGWNQNSRFALVRAVVERGTLRIDAYHTATGDKVLFGGHFYSDKAPGQSFAAVPFVAAARPAVRAAGVDPESPTGIAILSYGATLVTAALPMALAAWLLLRVARGLGASEGGALFAALVLGLGSPAWAYATLFMGHSMAAAGLMLAFAGAASLREAAPPRHLVLLGVRVGAAGGFATVTEYPAAPAALVLAFLALALVWPQGPRRVVRVAAGIALGASGLAAVIVAYHEAIFGSPFVAPVQHLYAFAHVSEKPFGVPRGGVVWALLCGPTRGLFVLSPALLAAPVGFAVAWRRAGPAGRARRASIVACVAIVVSYVLLNASYTHATGGWTYGPRYLAASFPFLCFGLAFAFTHAGSRLRALLAAAAIYCVAVSLVAVSTNVQPPENHPRPLSGILWPAFRAGRLSTVNYSFLGIASPPGEKGGDFIGRGAWNLGEVLGLRGHASLAPLALVWLGLGWVGWRLRSRAQTRGHPSDDG